MHSRPEVQTLETQVSALERGPPDGREGAAWTASSLAADPANIGAFVQADAVPRLLQMLKTGALPCDTMARGITAGACCRPSSVACG